MAPEVGYPGALLALGWMSRLREPVLRALTVRGEKEDQRTGFTHAPDDDGRAEERDDRRRGGRRGEAFPRRGDERSPRCGPGAARRSAKGARSFDTSVTLARRPWTTRVHDYHERILKEGQEYGEFQ
jgi:hypothetical protein